ncbi:MAG: hypothetical protein ABI847_19935 [Anaerolineales bacterium]
MEPLPSDEQPVSPKRVRTWFLYVVVALALVGALGWATLREIARNPARNATVELGAAGLVTIQLTTNPSPPLPTGAVQLSFMPMNPRQRPVPLDGLSYTYGREGNDEAVGSGEALAMSDGSGMFMGSAQFLDVGNWWVRVKLSNGSAQSEVRFMLYVKPAQ